MLTIRNTRFTDAREIRTKIAHFFEQPLFAERKAKAKGCQAALLCIADDVWSFPPFAWRKKLAIKKSTQKIADLPSLLTTFVLNLV